MALTPVLVTPVPVHNVCTLSTFNANVGYLALNGSISIATAENPLRHAINPLKASNNRTGCFGHGAGYSPQQR